MLPFRIVTRLVAPQELYATPAAVSTSAGVRTNVSGKTSTSRRVRVASVTYGDGNADKALSRRPTTEVIEALELAARRRGNNIDSWNFPSWAGKAERSPRVALHEDSMRIAIWL